MSEREGVDEEDARFRFGDDPDGLFDRFLKEVKAKAWDECQQANVAQHRLPEREMDSCHAFMPANPHRGDNK